MIIINENDKSVKDVIYNYKNILDCNYKNLNNLIVAITAVMDKYNFFNIGLGTKNIYLVSKYISSDFIFIKQIVNLDEIISKFGFNISILNVDGFNCVSIKDIDND